MERRRGDGLAVGAVILGTAAAWVGTSLALGLAWAAGGGGFGTVEAVVAAVTLAGAQAEQPRSGHAVGGGLTAPTGGVAFRASSLSSTSRVQGDYGGHLTREGDALRLRVPVARIRNSTDHGREDALLLGVRLLLMEDAAEGERVVREGELHLLREALSPGEELWLQDLELELAGVSEAAAVDRWLVIEHRLAGWSEGGVPRSEAWAYAPQETLWLLFDWAVEGC